MLKSPDAVCTIKASDLNILVEGAMAFGMTADDTVSEADVEDAIRDALKDAAEGTDGTLKAMVRVLQDAVGNGVRSLAESQGDERGVSNVDAIFALRELGDAIDELRASLATAE